MGSKNQGQGHETIFKQVLNERLGIDPNEVQYIDGDTDRVAFGIGTNGSRSTVIGGSALWIAADKIIAKGKKIAAHLLEAAEADIEFRRWRRFAVAGTDRRMAITDVAKATFQAGTPAAGLRGRALRDRHVLAVRHDLSRTAAMSARSRSIPIPASSRSSRYVVVDDVGTVVNPIGLKGQIHGGVAQGLGQAVMEQRRLRPRDRADAERQLHGLRDAARRRHAVS